MPPLSPDSQPKCRKHKASGQAIVTLSGQDHYLGPHVTAASRKLYDRLVAEWIANGRSAKPIKHEATIVELIAAYHRHAREYYRGSSEYDATMLTLKPLKELYGRNPWRKSPRSSSRPSASP